MVVTAFLQYLERSTATSAFQPLASSPLKAIKRLSVFC
jgi:C4-dicarboxylate transporter